MVAWDSRVSLIGMNALTPFLFLPAWPVAVAAVVGRRWALLSLTGLVIAAHVAFVAPELAARTPPAPGAASAPSFRLFDANVFAGNTAASGIAAEIKRAAPDVVMLEEISPTFLAALEVTGALGDLPYRVLAPRPDAFGLAVASRWALRDEEILYAGDRPVIVRATIDVAGRSLGLFAVHVVAPIGGNRSAWDAGLRLVLDSVAGERGPVVVAGDFNATWGNRPFRRLLDTGLVDAAAARGSPLQMTWPNSLAILPPVTRLDHVLTRNGLDVIRVRVGQGRGSDHRPLVADIALT